MKKTENVIEVQDFALHETPLVGIKRFELKAGEKVLLMGPSGCGKTSFIEFLAGKRKAKATKSVIAEPASIVFQDLNLIEEFSVAENLALELDSAGVERALKWLTQLDWQHSGKTLVRRLSKGEQQRVAVARAVASGRSLLLADEPTSHLDRKRADRLMELLSESVPTALIVSHDSQLERFVHRVVRFEDSGK